ncbi:hypothetical protein V2G26_016004 [Clonostachys chloroleuca]
MQGVACIDDALQESFHQLGPGLRRHREPLFEQAGHRRLCPPARSPMPATPAVLGIFVSDPSLGTSLSHTHQGRSPATSAIAVPQVPPAGQGGGKPLPNPDEQASGYGMRTWVFLVARLLR